MAVDIRSGRTGSPRHESFYLESGPAVGPAMLFVHGWPELSYSWREQLPVFGGLGFRCVAPDMRGYGRSTVHPRHADYAIEEVVADLLELLDGLEIEQAVLVGHDWGSPPVWSLAQLYPHRCLALASLCVPYQPAGFAPSNLIPLSDRSVYPEDRFPAAQWDYQLFYEENFEAASSAFEADIRSTVRALFRAGFPEGKGRPAVTASVRANGGWFGPGRPAPPAPRDERVLTQEEEDVYVEALTRNGFHGPDSWYMNAERNLAFAEKAPSRAITSPVLFLHAEYDYVCETISSRLAEPMREACSDLEEVVIRSGHWMAQEKPHEVNAAIARWLARKRPELFDPS